MVNTSEVNFNSAVVPVEVKNIKPAFKHVKSDITNLKISYMNVFMASYNSYKIK